MLPPKKRVVDPSKPSACRQQLEEQGICIFSSSWVIHELWAAGGDAISVAGSRCKHTNLRDLRVARNNRLWEVWDRLHDDHDVDVAFGLLLKVSLQEFDVIEGFTV